jgi:hypothetical protein
MDTEENHECKDSWMPGRDSKRATPAYKLVLPLGQTDSVASAR